MLSIPDIRATADYGCGDAAVDAVFRFLGVRTGVALARDHDGTHPVAIEIALRDAGLSVQSGTMTLDDLKHHTRLGRPVICPIAKFGGHWVVVAGVKRWVYYQCPSDGPQRDTQDAWLAGWADSTRAGHAYKTWGIASWSHES